MLCDAADITASPRHKIYCRVVVLSSYCSKHSNALFQGLFGSLSSVHYTRTCIVCFVAFSYYLTVIVAAACNAMICCVFVGLEKPTHEIITESSYQNTSVGRDVFFECNIRYLPNEILWLKDGEPLGKFYLLYYAWSYKHLSPELSLATFLCHDDFPV